MNPNEPDLPGPTPSPSVPPASPQPAAVPPVPQQPVAPAAPPATPPAPVERVAAPAPAVVPTPVPAPVPAVASEPSPAPAPVHAPELVTTPQPAAPAVEAAAPPSVASAELALVREIQGQIRKVFIGQHDLVEMVLTAFISSGHLLIEGHPGLGKTHLIVSLAKAFQGQFKRIQFTPDLMPSDVVGHSMYHMGTQSFNVKQGPVFTNLLLADEINRAPAKTQSALLEVMQERQATIDGESYPLPEPFMVLATQNPIEHDGTYPLPEAQLDRFMMKVLVTEPELQEEIEIATRATHSGEQTLEVDQVEAVATPEQIVALRKALRDQRVVPEVIEYAVKIVQATRESAMTSYGASPRASIALIEAAKGLALLRERNYVIPDDIKACALAVLRHRISLTAEVAISGQTVDETVSAIVNSVESPRV